MKKGLANLSQPTEAQSQSGRGLTWLPLVGTVTTAVGVVTAVLVSATVDPLFKIVSVSATILLLFILVLIVSGVATRYAQGIRTARYERRAASHPELISEMLVYVERADNLLGNRNFHPNLTTVYQSIIGDLQKAGVFKGSAATPTFFYSWLWYLRSRAEIVATSPERQSTSQFEALMDELGALISQAGDILRYHVQNMANDPSYLPSKPVKDEYHLFREHYSNLGTGYQTFVSKVNSILGTEAHVSYEPIQDLK